jgi:uncharacterized protein (DUF2267 family)
MSTTGLDVLDHSLHTTHIWLGEIMAELGPDRQVAYHALRAVLHALRDRLPLELAAHLGAQLPLIVRGIYYDAWHPVPETSRERHREAFLAHVAAGLHGIRPLDTELVTHTVLGTIGRHVAAGQAEKVRQALPGEIRALWPSSHDH